MPDLNGRTHSKVLFNLSICFFNRYQNWLGKAEVKWGTTNYRKSNHFQVCLYWTNAWISNLLGFTKQLPASSPYPILSIIRTSWWWCWIVVGERAGRGGREELDHYCPGILTVNRGKRKKIKKNKKRKKYWMVLHVIHERIRERVRER